MNFSRWRRSAACLLGAGLLATGLLTGCSDDDSKDQVMTVYAAASLKSTFEELGGEFEEDHDGVDVRFSFAGSSDLVAQLQQGAVADVFASADQANMDKLVQDDLAGVAPEIFARNTLTIVVPPGNPAGVRSLADLTGGSINLVVCAPAVPCGAASIRAAEAAGLTLSPVSEEQSVTDVLNKVIAGEADAGLVYVTDATGAGDKVEVIEFPEAAAAVNEYPITTVSGSKHEDLATRFMDLVLSEAGRKVLGEAGFQLP